MLSLGAANAVVADVDGFDHMSGWGWGWMMIGWLVMIALIGLFVWVFQRGAGPRDRQPTDEALEILASRYAGGEITREEYEERRLVLNR